MTVGCCPYLRTRKRRPNTATILCRLPGHSHGHMLDPAMSPARRPRFSGSEGGPRVDSDSSEQRRWPRVKAVFLEALEQSDAERDSFVADACGGDRDLQHDVECLLARDGAETSIFETPAAALLASDAPERGESTPRFGSGDRLGPYAIIAFVAAGGMGEVYRARHTVLGRQVAIKTIGANVTDVSARRRLVREAQNASTLSHPNICTIYEVGETDGAPFIVMEYIDGRPLDGILRDATPDVRRAIACGLQVADALVHAHERGIVHRDLKSSNIVIRPDGQAVVLDFGLAKRLPEGTHSRHARLNAHQSGRACRHAQPHGAGDPARPPG